MRSRLTLLCLLLTTTVAVRTFADDSASTDFFETKIRPVLVEHCYECHAVDAEKIRGGLLVDSREAIRKGGESGAGVVPGDPASSLVLDAMRYESFEMPPAGKLPAQVIADFEKWIQLGASDPRTSPTSISATEIDIEQGKQFWCFQPRSQSSPPPVIQTDWPDSIADQFIKARLEEQGLEPANDARRATLLRRAYFALSGLPPSPKQIDAFLSAKGSTKQEFALVVDHLLESPEFGERWGRHWLDVVRFAESSGGGRTLLFPDAWRYRDYVIEAFNSDLPFDQFVREQIAGDILAKHEAGDDWQKRRQQTIATAFLLLGPTNYELQDKDVLEMDIIDEQLDTIGKAFLGMTIGCARCHDHKFDPIPTSDYYALAGIFKGTKSVIHNNVSTWNSSRLPVPADRKQHLESHEAHVKSLEQQLAKLKQQKASLEKSAKARKRQTDAAKQEVVAKQADLAKQEVAKQIAKLGKELKQHKAKGPSWPTAMATVDAPTAQDIPISIRGMVNNPGRVVPRGFLQVAMNQPAAPISAGVSGRLELANWMTQPSNPLTARVIVNRVWYWLFGEGLVRTVDNFGVTGESPSHPQLLDHLANQFIEDGWSMKRLIRRLMLSHTYRLDSVPNATAVAQDPDNRWFSAANRCRLEAENIRDSLLQLSGRLDRRSGGNNIKPGTKIEYGYRFDSTRRSVYLPVFRNTLPPLFTAFDFADPNIQSGKRTSSTIAPQALLLMNSPFVIEQCQLAGERMAEHELQPSQQRSSQDHEQVGQAAGPEAKLDAKIRLCFQQVLSRLPSDAELKIATTFLGPKNGNTDTDKANAGEANASQQDRSKQDRSKQWALLYQTLVQSVDFRYVR